MAVDRQLMHYRIRMYQNSFSIEVIRIVIESCNHIIYYCLNLTAVYICRNYIVITACWCDIKIIRGPGDDVSSAVPLIRNCTWVCKKCISILHDSLWRRLRIDGNKVVKEK